MKNLVCKLTTFFLIQTIFSVAAGFWRLQFSRENFKEDTFFKKKTSSLALFWSTMKKQIVDLYRSNLSNLKLKLRIKKHKKARENEGIFYFFDRRQGKFKDFLVSTKTHDFKRLGVFNESNFLTEMKRKFSTFPGK